PLPVFHILSCHWRRMRSARLPARPALIIFARRRHIRRPRRRGERRPLGAVPALHRAAIGGGRVAYGGPAHLRRGLAPALAVIDPASVVAGALKLSHVGSPMSAPRCRWCRLSVAGARPAARGRSPTRLAGE